MFVDGLGARIVLAVLGIANLVLITRAAGIANYGIYASATAFATVMATLTDLGASSVVVREGVQSSVAIRSYLQMRAVLTVAACVIGAALALLALGPLAREPALVALGLIAFGGPSLVAPIGQIEGSMRSFRTSVLIQASGTFAFTVCATIVLDVTNPTVLVLAPVIAGAAATAYAVHSNFSWFRLSCSSFEWKPVIQMFRQTWLIGLSGALTTAFVRLDTLLLMRISGPTSAGLYAAAYRVLEQTRVVPAALLYPAAPIIARELDSRRRVSGPIDLALLRISVTGGLSLACFIAASAPVLVLLLGPAFEDSAPILLILCPTAAWSMLAFIATTKLIIGRSETRYFYSTALALAFNVTLNLLVIPRHGATGAAVVSTVTALLAVIPLIYFSRPFSSVPYVDGLTMTCLGGSALVVSALFAASISGVLSGIVSAMSIVAAGASGALAVRFLRGPALRDAQLSRD